jgi:Mn-dependent DtxR family transcriptional regulator
MNLTLPAAFVDRLSRLSPGATKTYLTLVWLKTTRTPHPTQPQIAEHMNASERSVITYLKELEESGYIEKRRFGSGRRTDYALLHKIGRDDRYGTR